MLLMATQACARTRPLAHGLPIDSDLRIVIYYYRSAPHKMIITSLAFVNMTGDKVDPQPMYFVYGNLRPRNLLKFSREARISFKSY
jgi:hypothetical protein